MRSKVGLLVLLFGILAVSVCISKPSWATSIGGPAYVENWIVPIGWNQWVSMSSYYLEWGQLDFAQGYYEHGSFGLGPMAETGSDLRITDAGGNFWDVMYNQRGSYVPGTGISALSIQFGFYAIWVMDYDNGVLYPGFNVVFPSFYVGVNGPDAPNPFTLPSQLPSVNLNIGPYSYVAQLNITGQLLHISLSPVPEPSTMLLIASGVIGFAGYGRKRFFKK